MSVSNRDVRCIKVFMNLFIEVWKGVNYGTSVVGTTNLKIVVHAMIRHVFKSFFAVQVYYHFIYLLCFYLTNTEKLADPRGTYPAYGNCLSAPPTLNFNFFYHQINRIGQLHNDHHNTSILSLALMRNPFSGNGSYINS